jgi:septum formation protein
MRTELVAAKHPIITLQAAPFKTQLSCIRMRLILASASPRRRELLEAAGLSIVVDPLDVDESAASGESAAAYVTRLAELKAAAGLVRHRFDVVLGADTTVVVDGEILGKPSNEPDAARMLRRLSGRSHEVLTGVAIVHSGGSRTWTERTLVWFAPLLDEEIAWYVASGEPMDKAGAYAIQGLASRFIPRIEGSYSNVVGLPVATVLQNLREMGLDSAVTSTMTSRNEALPVDSGPDGAVF